MIASERRVVTVVLALGEEGLGTRLNTHAQLAVDEGVEMMGVRGVGVGGGGGGIEGAVVRVGWVNGPVPVGTAGVGIAEGVLVPFRPVKRRGGGGEVIPEGGVWDEEDGGGPRDVGGDAVLQQGVRGEGEMSGG